MQVQGGWGRGTGKRRARTRMRVARHAQRAGRACGSVVRPTAAMWEPREASIVVWRGIVVSAGPTTSTRQSARGVGHAARAVRCGGSWARCVLACAQEGAGRPPRRAGRSGNKERQQNNSAVQRRAQRRGMVKPSSPRFSAAPRPLARRGRHPTHSRVGRARRTRLAAAGVALVPRTGAKSSHTRDYRTQRGAATAAASALQCGGPRRAGRGTRGWVTRGWMKEVAGPVHMKWGEGVGC